MKRIIITFGLMYGIYSIVASYLMLNQMVGMWTLSGLGFLVAFLVYFIGIRNYKSENGGFASFKEIFQLCMGIAIVGYAVSFIGSQIYMQTMSEDTKDELTTQFIDSQVSMYEGFGLDTEQIEDELTEQADAMFSMKNSIIGTFIGIIMMAVISVIFALIFKKDPPTAVV